MNESFHGMASKQDLDQSLALSVCADEPIRTPNAIQPFGYLLVVSSTNLLIVQASLNCSELLEAPIDEILNQPVKQFLDPSLFESVDTYLRQDATILGSLQIQVKSKLGTVHDLSCNAHYYDEGFFILELEHSSERSNLLLQEEGKSDLLFLSLSQLHSTETLENTVLIAAEEVRKLTNYDRVMVYKFHTDWHGEVIAEAKIEGLEPLLGLHYPASDIPEQARELYKRNLLRLIVDVDYSPVPISPVVNPFTSKILDMSDCILRSTSPVHIEYLKNMGVHASLTISIILKNKLWGLIACHHNSPLNQPQAVRDACKLFAQSFSLKLLGLHENAVIASQLVTLKVVDDLITRVRSGDGDLVQAFETVHQALMDLFEASSCARVLEDEVTTFGDAPQNNAIREFVAVLRKSGKRAFFAVDNRDLHPLKLPESASGFLALQIGLLADEWLIFFRPSQVQLVNWAGNPDKAVEIIDGELKLHPRSSFALWTQEVRDQSKPWTEQQIEVAEFLQSKLLSIRKEILDIDRKILQQSAQEKADFVASIAHDLKNPVLGTLKVLELLKAGRMGKTISEVADILQQVIDSQEILLARIKSITLGYQHADGSPRLTLGKASLRAVLEKSIKLSEKCTKSGQKFLVELGEDDLIINGDEDALSRVFENLLLNAINYSPLHGQISITVKSSEQIFEVRIVDTGVGITAKDLPKIFQRFWRGEQKSSSNSGSGLGLYICKKIVEGHGGIIECSSEVGVGTTFTVRLPGLAEEETNSD